MNQKALKFIVGFLAYPVFAMVLVGILFAVVGYPLVSAIVVGLMFCTMCGFDYMEDR